MKTAENRGSSTSNADRRFGLRGSQLFLVRVQASQRVFAPKPAARVLLAAAEPWRRLDEVVAAVRQAQTRWMLKSNVRNWP